jgi:DNA-directed RNA polymerase specialized sigma24 family protein
MIPKPLEEGQMASTQDVTALLDDWSRGNRSALNELLPLVYAELRRIAARQLRKERIGHTLQPTALVHEMYLRLVDQRHVDWQNRAHFLGVAAHVMRRILVDHARRQGASKRGMVCSASQSMKQEELPRAASSSRARPHAIAWNRSTRHGKAGGAACVWWTHHRRIGACPQSIAVHREARPACREGVLNANSVLSFVHDRRKMGAGEGPVSGNR